jgi:ankyrin repeat protein
LFCQKLIQQGNLSALADVLKAEPSLLNYAFEAEKRRTLLHLAVYEGQLKIVEWLLNQKGIDVQSVDFYGQTPLYSAIRFSTPRDGRFIIKA